MGEFGFGKRLGLLESSKHRFLVDVMHFYSQVMGFYEQFPEIAKIRLEYGLIFGRRLLRLDTAAQDQWVEWKDHFSASILQNGQSRKETLFSAVLNSRDKVPLSELWAEGSFLMLAGKYPKERMRLDVGLMIDTQVPIPLPQRYLAYFSTWRTTQTSIKN